jgi:hypothetical protein
MHKHKAECVLLIIFGLAVFVIVKLHQGAIRSHKVIFSSRNIILTGLEVIVAILILYIYEKYSSKNRKG